LRKKKKEMRSEISGDDVSVSKSKEMNMNRRRGRDCTPKFSDLYPTFYPFLLLFSIFSALKKFLTRCEQ
jgi:hypothetical protein